MLEQKLMWYFQFLDGNDMLLSHPCWPIQFKRLSQIAAGKGLKGPAKAFSSISPLCDIPCRLPKLFSSTLYAEGCLSTSQMIDPPALASYHLPYT